MERESIHIVWLKRNLRLRDHTPLKEAIAAGRPLLLLYFFEPSVLALPEYAPRHGRFTLESLQDLRRQFAHYSLPLYILNAEVVPTLQYLAEAYHIAGLFSHQETGLKATFDRDRAVQRFWGNILISRVLEGLGRTFRPFFRCKKKNRFMNTAKEKTQSLDKALKLLTYGNYIVTTRVPAEKLDTRDEDYVAAGTVSWAMQSSFEPPMITVAIRKDSDLRETMERAGSFVLTILGKKDRELVSQFRGDSDISDDRINGIAYSDGPETGNPVIEAGIAHFECEVSDRLESGGDHVLFVGHIVNVRENQEGTDPLYEWETGFQYGGVEFS